jgi:hypothetical protein
LAKKGVNTPPSAEVAFDLDVSGSFDDEHRGGLTQSLLERLVPWGMVFDPDQQLDIFTFSNGEGHAHRVGQIVPADCEGYVAKRIIDRVPGYSGGTDYSYVLEKNLQQFGWLPSSEQAPKKSFFKGLFGGGNTATNQPATKRKSIVLFVTDGDNSDKERTERILRESQARGDQVYFLFIAVSNQGGDFPFLRRIADQFSNTGLVIVRDLAAFTARTDEELNSELIGDELVAWLKN